MSHDEVTISRLTPQDHQACVNLSVHRDWAPDRHRWAHFLSHAVTYGVKTRAGQLISTLVTTRFPYPDGPDDLVTLGMMLVHADHERQGLGTRLLRHAFAAEPAAGYSLQATAMGQPVYQRLGFVDRGVTTVLRAPLAQLLDTPPPRATFDEADHPVTLDARLGSRAPDRWAHLEPTPFLAHRPLLDEHGTTAVGCWRNHDTLHLGPLTAASPKSALDAVSAAIHRHRHDPTLHSVRIEVPPGQDELLTLLNHAGFETGFTVIDMTLGDVSSRDPRQRALQTVATA